MPTDALWGAQTQRSIGNFPIAQDINKMPIEIIRAFSYLKKGAALANLDAGVISADKVGWISAVCDEIQSGALDHCFPLVGNSRFTLPPFMLFNLSYGVFF